MSTRGDILRRAAQVEPGAVPEPWRPSDDEDALATVSDREHYRKNLVTLPDGAGEVPAYVWDFPRTPTIPDEVREEWTRSSAGRVLNAQGQFVSRGSDVPRLSFDGDEAGLLVEAAGRTNYVVDSSDLSQWVKGGNVSLGSAVTSVIEGETAYKASQSAFSLFDPAQSKTLSDSTETTHALIETDTAGEFAIGVTNETAGNGIGRVIYDVSSGTVTTDSNSEGTIQQANARVVTPNTPNGGKLIHLILSFSTPNDGDTARFEYYPDTTNSGDTSIFHHGQWEEAPNASSPIVTQGSATTRSADDYTISVGDWFNPNEGTIIIEVTPKFYLAGGNFNLTTFLRAGTKEKSKFEWKKALELQLRVNSQFKNLSVTPFSKAKVAASFDSGTSSTVFSVNGSSTVINRSGFLSDIDSAGTLNFGDAVGTAFGSIVWVPRALPESTLNAITS